METKLLLHNFQELPAPDLNAMQAYAQASIDAIVKELLFDEGRFTGLAVTTPGPLEIDMAAGRLYRAGKVYNKPAISNHSLVNYLPAANQRYVLIVVTGEEVETNTQVRKFLIDATTRQTQPRPVPTNVSRQIAIDFVQGAESASPQVPATPANSLGIATVLLTSAGISEIQIIEANKALNLEAAVNQLALLEAAQARNESLFNTLRSDIAALGKKLQTKSDEADLLPVWHALYILRERVDIPDINSIFGIDMFESESESDVAHGDYNAIIDHGAIRFGQGDRTIKATNLLNPQEPKLTIADDGLILPKFTGALRLSIAQKAEEIGIASYPTAVRNFRRLTMTHTYRFYSPVVGRENTAAYIKANKTALRVRDPETGEFVTLDLTGKPWTLIHSGAGHVWRIKVNAPYWSVSTTLMSVTGASLAQTSLCSQSGWFNKINLGFTAIGPTGDVHLAICELLENGTPDLENTIAAVTVARADLKLWPAWSPFNFIPFFKQAGKRYAMVVTTTGNHKLAVAFGNDLTNGTLFASTDGVYWHGDLARDLCFQEFAARFDATKVIIELEDVTLAGGIAAIETAFRGFEPAMTDLVVEARVAGVWRPLSEEDATILAGLPTQLPLRLVFTGTKDVMPALNKNKSSIVVSRPTTPTIHVSTARDLPAAVTTASVTVVEEALGFVEADHDWTVALLTGVGWETVEAHDSVVTSDMAGGKKRRVWKFTGIDPEIDTYKIRTTMVTANAATQFAVVQRADYAV